MATLNIYLPDGLKAEMDAKAGMNWSGICQHAIRTELQAQNARETMNIDAIAERIRATGGNKSPKYQAGFKDGREWAAEAADADDMESILAIGSSSELVGDSLNSKLHDFMSRMDWDEWMWGDGQPMSERYLDGFVDGAVEILREVETKL